MIKLPFHPPVDSFVGVDPGLSGAIAVFDVVNWRLGIIDIPVFVEGDGKAQDPDGLVEIFRAIRPRKVTLEMMIAMHSNPSPNTTLKLGRWRGHFEGIFAAEGIDYHQVRAVDWKRKMGCTADKALSLARARTLFPGCLSLFTRVKDDGRAEAAIIGLHGILDAGLRPTRPITLLT